MEQLIQFVRENWFYCVLLADSIAIFIQGFALKKSNKVLPLNDIKSMIAYHKRMLSVLEKVSAGMTDNPSSVCEKDENGMPVFYGSPAGNGSFALYCKKEGDEKDV